MRVVLIATLVLACAFAQKPPQADPVELRGKDKEALLAAHLAEEFRKRSQIVENAPVQRYVEALGKCLAAKLTADPVPFTFALMMNDPTSMHEPITLPGGYIFVPARLFVAAETESEFAGMLAHCWLTW
jgi:predicted Zn-dependent protease